MSLNHKKCAVRHVVFQLKIFMCIFSKENSSRLAVFGVQLNVRETDTANIVIST